LSPTLIGSASTHSCSEGNAVDFVCRTCRGLTNYLKTPTLLCFIKSPLTVVMSCISFYRHFRLPHRTIVCVIELISSACQTTQDALWIVTFLLGPCSRTFINLSYHPYLSHSSLHFILWICVMSVFHETFIVLYCVAYGVHEDLRASKKWRKFVTVSCTCSKSTLRPITLRYDTIGEFNVDSQAGYTS